jgi:peptidoglycan/LPS O-acetylase OafA/YrhL
MKRIDYLDGLRGLAILLVLGFHAFSRWPELVPYGDTYQDFALFKLGWIGVELFFLISGFVIFMSLDKTDNFRLYLYKRWLRLFPAMLLASVLIYASTFILNARPLGEVSYLSLIPGLTFMKVGWWSGLLGTEIPKLEGVFWSLYVEFKFYIAAGLIYFFMGRKYLVPSLTLIFISAVVVTYFHNHVDSGLINIMYLVCEQFALNYFGWFSAGAMFYLFHQTQRQAYFYTALALAGLSAIFVNQYLFSYDKGPIIAAMCASLLFAMSLRVELIQNILRAKILLFFGFISYPFYLTHESAMISMIIQFEPHLSWLPTPLLPLIPIAILTIIAYLIAVKGERLTKQLVLKVIGQS